ncbi:MAG: TRAP transporter small permease [Nitratireductor sp.]|nr:TRAP transporter small permease [Nitratireductor sp.]MCC0021189.1 TRAP transporter small permease [Nitratireductor sp.]
MRAIRSFLDGLYRVSAFLAAACLMAILAVIVLQMGARWFGIAFPGSSEYAGYLMAAASFLAFAHALNSGSHIRVSLLLTALGRHRFWGELWAYSIGSAASAYMAWYAVKMVRVSLRFHDVSQGQDATPLWIVQLPVAFGAILLAIAFIDNLISIVATGSDNIRHQVVEGAHGDDAEILGRTEG